MLKIIGAIIIIAASAGIGFYMSDSIKRRIIAVNSLCEFVEYVSGNIMLYKTPLDNIYSAVSDEYLKKTGFAEKLDHGVYAAAVESGLLSGDEERDIIRDFGEKIGGGTAEDMVKLCAYTSSRLRSLSDALSRDLPDKRRVYHTVSFLAGVSAVIVLF